MPCSVEAVTAHELAKAITSGAITLAYQPQVSLSSGAVCGVEALARWTHPAQGPIPPAEFIPLAEQCDLIDALTDSVLTSALGQWREWHSRGLDLNIAVNISARSLSRLNLPDAIHSRCMEFGVPDAALTIELTESCTQSAARLMDTLTRFRLKGMRVSLDDFGTGYSSLAQLQKLPFSELKIDRCFVTELNHSTDARAIVGAIVALAHGLGLKATAEGVEDAGTLNCLAELGCDAAQGYWIGRPMRGTDVPIWIANRTGSAGAVGAARIQAIR